MAVVDYHDPPPDRCSLSLYERSPVRIVECRRLCASGFLKEADPLFKVVCNVRGRLLFGDAFRLNIDQGLPETCSPNGKTDEPGNARRCRQPAYDPRSLCTTSEHNETHSVPSITPSHLHQLDAIFLAIKPFDLPDIWLNPGVLQCLDGLHHQARAQLQVIGVRVPLNLFQLHR